MYYPIPDRASELLYALADERWRAVGKDLALDTEAQRNELRDKLYQKRDPAITTGSGRRDSTEKGQVVLLPAIDWDNLNDFGWPRNKDVDKPKSQASADAASSGLLPMGRAKPGCNAKQTGSRVGMVPGLSPNLLG